MTDELFTCYLAGPMRGIDEFNFPLFMRTTAVLRQYGHTVCNPAERDLEQGFDPTGLTGDEDLAELGFDLREALAYDLGFIAHVANAIVLLPGWQNSSGAKAEAALGLALGLDFYLPRTDLTTQYGTRYVPFRPSILAAGNVV